MFLISDLDSTLIYSHQDEGVCVEYLDGRPITYMTDRAFNMLDMLLTVRSFHLVPCTLRSWEQTSRVSFVREGRTPIVVCDNGFSIIREGFLDKDWDRHMHSIIETDKIAALRSKILRFVEKFEIPIKQVKSNRDSFLTLIFQDAQSSKRYADGILSVVPDDYKISKQGRKIYIIPLALDKSLAVKYLQGIYKDERFITAGDSDVDKKFVLLGDIRIIPRHSSIELKNAVITKQTGALAAEDILEYCIKSNDLIPE